MKNVCILALQGHSFCVWNTRHCWGLLFQKHSMAMNGLNHQMPLYQPLKNQHVVRNYCVPRVQIVYMASSSLHVRVNDFHLLGPLSQLLYTSTGSGMDKWAVGCAPENSYQTRRWCTRIQNTPGEAQKICGCHSGMRYNSNIQGVLRALIISHKGPPLL